MFRLTMLNGVKIGSCEFGGKLIFSAGHVLVLWRGVLVLWKGREKRRVLNILILADTKKMNLAGGSLV